MLKVTYVPNHLGSERVSFRVPIPKYKHLTLSFDVKFCEDFDFEKGGKLHGVGPDKPITGGFSGEKLGWSVRILFKPHGHVASYIYHPEMKGMYGESITSKVPVFKPGLLHKIKLEVKLNTTEKTHDGYVKIYVDERLQVMHKNLSFYLANEYEQLISNLLFSTFYGGNNISFAPKNSDNKLQQQCAYFGNFVVDRP